MPIIGFTYTKIFAEKTEQNKGKVDINNNVSIRDVKEGDFSLGSAKESTLKFIFDFTTTYNPKVGSILFEGEVIYMDEAKTIKDILKMWKEGKKLPQPIMTSVLNMVLNRSNIQAMILSRDINLPPPIPLPKVQVQEQQDEQAKQPEKKAEKKPEKKK